MAELVVSIGLALVGVYTLAGLAAAGWLLMGGLARVDATAAASGWGFRLLIVPGLVALWPLLLAAWFRVRGGGLHPPAAESSIRMGALLRRHRVMMSGVAVVGALTLVAALLVRPAEVVNAGPVRLAQSYGGYGVEFRVAAGGELVVAFAEPLPISNPALYWYPRLPDAERGAMAQFVGMLEATGERRFAVPPAATRGEGHFVVLSFTSGVALPHRESIVGGGA